MKTTDDRILLKTTGLIAFAIGALELIGAAWQYVQKVTIAFSRLANLWINHSAGNAGMYIVSVLMIGMSITLYIAGCRRPKSAGD